MNEQIKVFDAIIIGGGPCGISAALYIKNANLDVAVLHNNKSTLKKAEHIRNFYGFFNPNDKNNDFTGENLYNKGLEQASAMGIQVIEEEVFGVEYINYTENGKDSFIVTGQNGNYTAKSVLLAIGEQKETINAEGFSEFAEMGKGISFCAVCDAFFYRKKEVAVVGSGEYALHEANELSNSASKVTILTDGKESKTDLSDFEVVTKKISRIFGDEKFEGVEFDDGTVLYASGLFVAIGSADSIAIAKKMGVTLDEKGSSVVVNENFKSSIDGFYIAGDTVNSRKQIASAVYGGMIAGLDMIKYIRNLIKKEMEVK